MTNWMGDDGFLKRLKLEMRRFNVFGDVQWCKGTVARKYIHQNVPLVDIKIWTEEPAGRGDCPRLRYGDTSFPRPPSAVVHRRTGGEPAGRATGREHAADIAIVRFHAKLRGMQPSPSHEKA